MEQQSVADRANQIFDHRYILHEELGHGGMGVVYLATDRLTRQKIALKRVVNAEIPGTTPGGVTQASLALAQEFQVLASLRHPNIIKVLDYGFDQERQPYFTMTLLDNARPIHNAAHGLPLSSKVKLLLPMLQALAYLHQRGILHRDLKPNNVLVNSEGIVIVLDFGLAVEQSQATGTVGTLAYMAPETLRDSEASIASDLYATGVIAYQTLTGRHPFPQQELSQLISAILTEPPDLGPLWAIHRASLDATFDGITYDEDATRIFDRPATETPTQDKTSGDQATSSPVALPLAGVIEKLLQKKPALRYLQANEVIIALSSAVNEPVTGETSDIRESYLNAARFVGRASELDQLTVWLNQAVQGKGQLCLVGGESGVGKSRLLDELRIRALVKGTMVLRSQSLSEGSLLYQSWRDPLRRLLLITELRDGEAEVLKQIIPDIADLLERPIADAPELPARTMQQRLLGTVAGIFQRQKQPLLLILEDLHWAVESLEILQHLSALLPDLPILIVGTYRDDEKPDLPSKFPKAVTLKLPRLNDNEVAALSSAMLGEVGQQSAIVALLQRETEGNILFLVETIRTLAEEAGGLGKIDTSHLPAQVKAGGVLAIFQRRLGRLPENAVARLRLAAVAGRQIDLRLLDAAEKIQTGIPDNTIDEWLTLCVNATILEWHDGQWRFVHDKLREAILHAIPEAERRDLHANAAQALTRLYPGAEYAGRRAYHWNAAGNPSQEIEARLQAGLYAESNYTVREAINHFSRLAELIQDDAQTIQINYHFGFCYSLINDYAEATRYYEKGLELARAHGEQGWIARILVGLGNVHSEQSDYRGAMPFFEQAQTLSHALDLAETEAQAHAGMGNANYNLGQVEQALQEYEKALAINRRLGNQRNEATNLGSLANCANFLGNLEQALIYYDQALTLNDKNVDPRGKAINLLNAGNVYHTQGNLRRARENFQQAQQISHSIGDRRVEGSALINLGNASASLGQFNDARSELEQALATSRAIGNRRGEGIALGNLASTYINLGDHDLALAAIEQALAICREIGIRQIEAYFLGSYGQLLSLRRDPRAGDVLRQAVALADSVQDPSAQAGNSIFLAWFYLRTNQPQAVLDLLTPIASHDIDEHRQRLKLFQSIALLQLRKPDEAREMAAQSAKDGEAMLVKTPQLYSAKYDCAVALAALAVLDPANHEQPLVRARDMMVNALENCKAPGVIADSMELLGFIDPDGRILSGLETLLTIS